MSKYREDYFCDTCAYKGVDETEEPCKSCCHCYEDKYAKQSCKQCVHGCVCYFHHDNPFECGFGCKYYTLEGGRK